MSRRRNTTSREIGSKYYRRRYINDSGAEFLSAIPFCISIPLATTINKMNRGIALALIGISALLFGFQRMRAHRIRGWYGRLKDRYAILIGVLLIGNGAAAFCADIGVQSDALKSWTDHGMGWLNGGIMLTLGIVYPILTALEFRLLKKHCGEPLEAEVADVIQIMVRRTDGKGEEHMQECCPVFRIWRNGRTEYVCDERFTNAKFEAGEPCEIWVHPTRNTEIYDKKRAGAIIKADVLGWSIYDFCMLLVLGMLWLMNN